MSSEFLLNYGRFTLTESDTHRLGACFLKNNEENGVVTLLHVLAHKIMTLYNDVTGKQIS